MTWHHFRNDAHFSVWLALLRLMDECGGRIGLTRISKWARHRKDNWILSYLETVFAPVINQYHSQNTPGDYQENPPIWVCWWQGEEQAPELIKQCIRSIRRHAGNHDVIIITQENYRQYMDIPDYILEKVNNGSMCIANFSDYLRMGLLALQGGLWLDATIYVAHDIPEEYYKFSIFTQKGITEDTGYISMGRWTSFCIGGWKCQPLFEFFKIAFEHYWKHHSHSIDYLFVDYCIEIARRHLLAVSKKMDDIPVNNPHINDLQAAMNSCRRADDFDSVIKPDTTFYKLSWRESYSKFTPDNHESIYSYFLNLKI